MTVPKKISPDPIQQAIVQIKFNSNFSAELIPGFIFQSLDESYFYVNRPLGQAPSKQDGIVFELPAQNLFHNEKITILVLPNSLIFNFKESYISWAEYLPEIKKALEQIAPSNVIHEFTQLGVRYVNNFKGTLLSDSVKFKFEFGHPEVTSNSYSFRSDFFYGEYLVNLNLQQNTPLASLNPADPQAEKISVLDIDVIIGNLGMAASQLPDILKHIDQMHTVEKEIFFKSLKSDFLATLNPEY